MSWRENRDRLGYFHAAADATRARKRILIFFQRWTAGRAARHGWRGTGRSEFLRGNSDSGLKPSANQDSKTVSECGREVIAEENLRTMTKPSYLGACIELIGITGTPCFALLKVQEYVAWLFDASCRYNRDQCCLALYYGESRQTPPYIGEPCLSQNNVWKHGDAASSKEGPPHSPT